MARGIQFTSMEAYRKAVLSGKVTTIKDRVMRFLFVVETPVTRRQMEAYFDPRGQTNLANDGKKCIKWSSMTGAIAGMIDDGYIVVTGEGQCPVTKENPVQFIAPGDPETGRSWENRRMF